MAEYIVEVTKIIKEEYMITAESPEEAMNEAHEEFLMEYGDYDEMECKEIVEGKSEVLKYEIS